MFSRTGSGDCSYFQSVHSEVKIYLMYLEKCIKKSKIMPLVCSMMRFEMSTLEQYSQVYVLEFKIDCRT